MLIPREPLHFVTVTRCRNTEKITVIKLTMTHTHTRLMALCLGLPGMSQYQECKTNLDYTEARNTEWQVSTSLQTDNYASTPKHSFLQAGCPSCRPTNSAKALKTN